MPQASFDDIVSDCKDSLAWCIKNLPDIVGAETIDIDRYVVAGDSAGGTLSTLCGHLLSPSPKVVIDVFGVIDPLDTGKGGLQNEPWSRDYGDKVEEIMEKAKMDRDLSKAEFICPWYWEYPDQMDPEDLKSFWGLPDFEIQDKHKFRMDLNNYIGLKRERSEILYRKDTFKSEEDYIKYIKSMSAYHLLDGKSKSDYPPTFILHGTGDTAVHVEQSYKFAKKLRELGIEVDERYKEGGEHCFENKIEVSPTVFQGSELTDSDLEMTGGTSLSCHVWISWTSTSESKV